MNTCQWLLMEDCYLNFNEEGNFSQIVSMDLLSIQTFSVIFNCISALVHLKLKKYIENKNGNLVDQWILWKNTLWCDEIMSQILYIALGPSILNKIGKEIWKFFVHISTCQNLTELLKVILNNYEILCHVME